MVGKQLALTFLLIVVAALAAVVIHGVRTRAIRARNRELEGINVRLHETIAQSQRATEALGESEERYRSVVSALSEGISLYDAEVQLVAHNASAERILGLNAEQLAGRSLIDPRWRTIREDHSPFPADEYPAVLTLFDGRARHEVIMGVEKPDGERSWISINTRPIMRPGHDSPLAVVASFSDITRRRQAEEDRQNLIDDLAAKNRELERFTYTVSHELKSPLVTIKGFLGLLAKDLAADNKSRMQRDIERIDAAAGKMGRLLEDLLALSRIGQVVHEPAAVALCELAQEAVDLTAGAITARGVTVDVSPDLPVVDGDRVRILEVFQNLIENAVKFSGQAPEPRIEVGVREDSEAPAPICFVADNGVGIEPQYQDKIFGLFERLDQDVEGTGIGLTLVQRIVEIHGGRIWVESAGEGQGSTFCFTLSAAAEES